MRQRHIETLAHGIGAEREYLADFPIGLCGASALAQVIGHEATLFGVVRREPPFAVSGFEVREYWHVRCHVEPAHRWLRKILRPGIIGKIERAN